MSSRQSSSSKQGATTRFCETELRTRKEGVSGGVFKARGQPKLLKGTAGNRAVAEVGALTMLHNYVGSTQDMFIHRVSCKGKINRAMPCPVCEQRQAVTNAGNSSNSSNSSSSSSSTNLTHATPSLYAPTTLLDLSQDKVVTDVAALHEVDQAQLAREALEAYEKHEAGEREEEEEEQQGTITTTTTGCDMCRAPMLFHSGRYVDAVNALMRARKEAAALERDRTLNDQQDLDEESLEATVQQNLRSMFSSVYNATGMYWTGGKELVSFADMSDPKTLSVRSFDHFAAWFRESINTRRAMNDARLMLFETRNAILREHGDALQALEEAMETAKEAMEAMDGTLEKDKRQGAVKKRKFDLQRAIREMESKAEKSAKKRGEGGQDGELSEKDQRMMEILERKRGQMAEAEAAVEEWEALEEVVAYEEAKRALEEARERWGLTQVLDDMDKVNRKEGARNGRRGVKFEHNCRHFVEEWAKTVPCRKEESVHVVANVTFHGMPYGCSNEFDFLVLRKNANRPEYDEVVAVVECKLTMGSVVEDIGQMLDTMLFFQGNPYVEGQESKKVKPSEVDPSAPARVFDLSTTDHTQRQSTFSGRLYGDLPAMTFVGASIEVPSMEDAQASFVLTPESFAAQNPVKEDGRLGLAPGVLYVTTSGWVEVGKGVVEHILLQAMDHVDFDENNDTFVRSVFDWTRDNVWTELSDVLVDFLRDEVDRGLMLVLKKALNPKEERGDIHVYDEGGWEALTGLSDNE